jgi:hypothetical protein
MGRGPQLRSRPALAVASVLALLGLVSCGNVTRSSGDVDGVRKAAGGVEGDCGALVGVEPWIVLSDDGPLGAPCFLVGVHQDVRVVNKGTRPIVVGWQGADHMLDPDDWFLTGLMGDAGLGEHAVSVGVGLPIGVIVIAPEDTPSGSLRLNGALFGDVQLGMTLAEASEAIGGDVLVDPGLPSGPTCLAAAVEGDPYSPVFNVVEVGGPGEQIIGIVASYPVQLSVGRSEADPSCAP